MVSIVSSAAARLSTSSEVSADNALVSEVSRVWRIRRAMRRPLRVNTTDTARPSCALDPLDEAFGHEAIDEADCARVGQAQNGAQLCYRPAVEELVQGGQCGGGRRTEPRDRFDGCIHPVGDHEAQRAQGVGCVLAT